MTSKKRGRRRGRRQAESPRRIYFFFAVFLLVFFVVFFVAFLAVFFAAMCAFTPVSPTASLYNKDTESTRAHEKCGPDLSRSAAFVAAKALRGRGNVIARRVLAEPAPR